MPYDANGRAYSRRDLPGAVPLGARVIAGVVACIVLLAFGRICWDAGYAEGAGAERPGHLVLDTSDAGQMHAYGMPTADDVRAFGLHGQWGYRWGGRVLAYDALPGSGLAWERLYGLDG